MNIFRIKKQLRRRWRRWRRAIWTIGGCGLVTMMTWLGLMLSNQMEQLMAKEPIALETLGIIREAAIGAGKETDLEPAWIEQLSRSRQRRTVHLNKIYACGEESSVLGILSPNEVIEIYRANPGWQGSLDAQGDVWFEQQINELSETCRSNGYFGIDQQGNLSLFEGPPDKEKVLKTFFQLDVETMESSLPPDVLLHLHQGIRIQDLDEYNSVLSTFSEFAAMPARKVMQQKDE
ncbi:BofC C-terminal domain-containing protein [Paenibacillus woosongensis]|uniref:BofC C-terminal domain-containing protein n=1 Tax=Paenibacillus woosongensis TaxID=307580 RepID=A0AA95I054_9BACL|nr:BofC C-terminal domain-containing protein [Paenibacillus woosongensis]WHX48059.1 BofC C-terminal domain-containing protein [Paenibacillus woosongensis]